MAGDLRDPCLYQNTRNILSQAVGQILIKYNKGTPDASEKPLLNGGKGHSLREPQPINTRALDRHCLYPTLKK